MEKLVGRVDERVILEEALSSASAELIAVYGRRRVGKTFLIRSMYADRILFDFTGIQEARLPTQLENFTLAFQKAIGSSIPMAVPKNWLQAFHLLEQFLTPKITNRKSVVFFDEFPWIHTQKSGFLQAFGHFWNTWASRQSNIIIVICGSAASWMIRNIVNNKGGLHNRITKIIRLLPFNLHETALYLKSRGVKLDNYQLLLLYMSMGGIPHYLKEVKPGHSAAQTIDRLFFSKSGMLKMEFGNLYKSLFDETQPHLSVIKALAKKSKGLTRNEIMHVCNLSSGGTATLLLEELEESGFITRYIPFEKDFKDSIYKLYDEYTLFYLKFIESARSRDKGTWSQLSNSPSFTSWSGFAFESICQKHISQVKKALGIEAVYTEISGWRYMPARREQGAQIDLLIDRRDLCINICEMKFSTSEFTIDKRYAAELASKLQVFKENTKTKKTLFLTMITSHGVKQNIYYTGLVQSQLTSDALFRE